MHKSSFTPENFIYDAPDKHEYMYTMRIHPAPRDMQLGLDPTSEDSLPEVLEYNAQYGTQFELKSIPCFLRIDNPETVQFFQTWDQKNLDAYAQHAGAFGVELWNATYFKREYHRMLTSNNDGAKLCLIIDLPSERTHSTKVFKAQPGEEPGQFRLQSCTHESIKVGSRLMVRASAWYLGVSKQGSPTCKLCATEVVVFPAKPAASTFTLPKGMSFLTE